MIDYVVGGEFLNVSSSKGAVPYINMSSQQPMVGSVSWDSSSQNMKVYDGSVWMTVGGGSASVNLTPDALAILKWAKQKMQEEQDLQALCSTNPAIKDLVDQMNSTIADYQSKIAMVRTLLKEEVKVGTS